MKKLFIFLILLFGELAQAQQTINDELADPTAMTNSLKKGLEGTHLSPENKKLNPAVSSEEVSDPTQMNQNFREALNQLKTNSPQKGNAPNAIVKESNTPQIVLMANVHRSDANKNQVVLRVDNKSEIVGVGDSITYFQGDNLMKIDVLEITKKYVKVMLVPTNQTLIIR